MDKKSNVIPFFRFPDPKTATYDPQVLIDLDMTLEKAFNNPALKQFETPPFWQRVRRAWALLTNPSLTKKETRCAR